MKRISSNKNREIFFLEPAIYWQPNILVLFIGDVCVYINVHTINSFHWMARIRIKLSYYQALEYTTIKCHFIYNLVYYFGWVCLMLSALFIGTKYEGWRGGYEGRMFACDVLCCKNNAKNTYRLMFGWVWSTGK